MAEATSFVAEMSWNLIRFMMPLTDAIDLNKGHRTSGSKFAGFYPYTVPLMWNCPSHFITFFGPVSGFL
jgi:hypothetical protein